MPLTDVCPRSDLGLPPDVVAASLGNVGVGEVVGIESMVSLPARPAP